jgi:hypothetical protein
MLMSRLVPRAIAAHRNRCLQLYHLASPEVVLTSDRITQPMFDPRDARQEFENFLNGRNLRERNLNLSDACEAFFDFYRDLRPHGGVFEQHEDADMLLFQWGSYDWGRGEHFSFNLTRQLIVSEDAEDEDIWQLSLTFEFEPHNELRALGRGDQWCHSLLKLPEFREYVYRSAAFTTCTKHQIQRTVIDYGVAG